MKRNYLLLTIATMLTVCSLSGCKGKESVDLTGIHNAESTAAETMAETTKAEETQKTPEITLQTEARDDDTSASTALSVRSKLTTEQTGKVSIEYPVLSNLKDKKTEELVNAAIKDSALRILTAYELNPEKDNVTVSCDIVSLDRDQVILTFKGSMKPETAAYPSALFYTLTMDLDTGKLSGLKDYADPYTMAGYILSEDCVIKYAEDKKAAREYLDTIELESLWMTLENSDFSTAGTDGFPEVFSYTNQGVIHIALPVPHALGDYILITFNPEDK